MTVLIVRNLEDLSPLVEVAPGSSRLVYDRAQKRPGAANLQEMLGGDPDALRRLWPEAAWLPERTPTMRVTVVQDTRWKQLARPWMTPRTTCATCGKMLVSRRLDRLYCSPLCTVKAFRKTEHGAASRRQSQRDNYYRHHDKSVARYQVKLALLDGRLVKPRVCSECGDAARYIEAHHPNGYDEKHWLDVAWLCKRDHMAKHRRAVSA